MKRALPAVILTLAMAGCLKSGGTIPAPAPPSSPKTDQELIQGTWTVTGMEFNGTVRPMDPKHGPLPTVAFNRNTIIDSTKPGEKIAFSLDPDNKPPVMRKVITRANGSTVTVFLAYELQSDRLRICENRDPLKPPTEFTSENQLVSILRRGTNPPVEKPTTNQKTADDNSKAGAVAVVKEPATLRGHASSVRSVCFSPDGKTLASAGYFDRTIKLWDLATGKESATLEGHWGGVFSANFSRDGKSLVSAAERVMVWDVATGKARLTILLPTSAPGSACFSTDPAGKTLAVGGGDGPVYLYDAVKEKEPTTLRGHTAWVWSVCFSPDGAILASGSQDNTIKLWDMATGKERATLKGHTSVVDSVCFSPDGKTLASASWDSTIKLWNVGTAKELATLLGHKDLVQSVSFSPDGKTLASASSDGTIKLWDVATAKERATLQGHTKPVLSVCFSPDGKTLASGSDDQTIKLWDMIGLK